MKSKLKRILITVMMLAALGFASGSISTVNADEGEGAELGDAVVLSADVLAVDKKNRILTLMGPKGNVIDIEATEDVRNFKQIAVGDKVKIMMYESIAVYLGHPGSQPDAEAGVIQARAAKGDKPAGVEVSYIDVSAEVFGIDKKNRTVTLELPEGEVVTSRVDESAELFDDLKVGDSIHARITRAVAVSVESN